ncbi:MAG: NTP transferase domain-containing protein [Candidatus Hydrogenedentes bacterium]|nr:NTP transferase domain-containing protein [Candidatus Hydrogenedentota bacterium]
MQAPAVPKVCFPVAGKPAVAHLLEILIALGTAPNVLVVGHLAGKVVDEVGPKFPQALFAFQAELLGTGHAAKQGAAVLRQLEFDGAVLVIAGDKVVERRALEKLVQAFEADHADAALVVAPKSRWPEAGRIITNDQDRFLQIMERADLRDAAKTKTPVVVDGKNYTAQEVEDRVQWINQAIYLYRADALFDVLGRLGRDNIQQEEYLTDTFGLLVKSGKNIVTVPVDEPEDVLAFNTPEELLEIEEHFRRKTGLEVGPTAALDPRIFKTPHVWANSLANPDGTVKSMLHAIYGDSAALCEEKRRHLLETVELFIRVFGNEGKVAVIRAPGRVNLMGRHVDHRGGHVNLIAIDREQILVARGRTDTTVRARNTAPDQFADIDFTAGDLLRLVRLDDWRDFVNSEAVICMVRDLQGDWGNYLKAPMLRLQQQFKTRQIKGLDCVVRGDIPMAAGLSSSSALVVAMAEALVLVNGLDVSPNDLVDLCGEGEWFVGTRGGAADHAAVKLSQFGQIAHVSFFPFQIEDYVPFPEGHALVICNSRLQARKSHSAKDVFNERVASYEFAVHLVRRRFPNYAPLIRHLRDISPAGLSVRSADVYRILLDIPEAIAPETLVAELGTDTCEKYFATHRRPERYHLRGRLLFGIAECARSRFGISFLRNGDLKKFGWLMNISHDGDRIVHADGGPFAVDVSDVALRGRIEDLQSEDPERVFRAQLYAQPGVYACSTPEIDQMVEIALATPGVLGAQLSGAGLGGCMMVLVRTEAADEVVRRMSQMYYEPRGLEPGAAAFTPIAGCNALALGNS